MHCLVSHAPAKTSRRKRSVTFGEKARNTRMVLQQTRQYTVLVAVTKHSTASGSVSFDIDPRAGETGNQCYRYTTGALSGTELLVFLTMLKLNSFFARCLNKRAGSRFRPPTSDLLRRGGQLRQQQQAERPPISRRRGIGVTLSPGPSGNAFE